MPLEGQDLEERTRQKVSLVRAAEGEVVLSVAAMLKRVLDDHQYRDLFAAFVGESGARLGLTLDNLEALDCDYPFDVFCGFFVPSGLLEVAAICEGDKSFAELALLRFPHLASNVHRAFVEAMRDAHYRILLIEKRLSGSQIKLLDIETNESFVVTDYRLSAEPCEGVLMLAPLFQMWGDVYLVGSLPFVLPASQAPVLVQLIALGKEILTKDPGIPFVSRARNLDVVRRTVFIDAVALLNNESQPREIRNFEGQRIEPMQASYRLLVDSKIVVDILNVQRGFEMASAEPYAEFAWLSAPTSKAAKKMNGPVLKGRVMVTSDLLFLEANSVARAKALRKKVEQILAERIELVEFKAGTAPCGPVQEDQALHSPEVQLALKDRLRELSARWVDSPIPALNGLTPRAAAQDPNYRGALRALLMSMEQRAQQQTEGVYTMDVDLIRKLLNQRAG
jgi:hypothetical protein